MKNRVSANNSRRQVGCSDSLAKPCLEDRGAVLYVREQSSRRSFTSLTRIPAKCYRTTGNCGIAKGGKVPRGGIGSGSGTKPGASGIGAGIGCETAGSFPFEFG